MPADQLVQLQVEIPGQTVRAMSSGHAVPASRLSRLGQLGRLAGGIAGGLVSEGARQLAQGQRPTMAGLLLTPANAQRLTERLAKMRGAAMKVGQLLSMDSDQLLPRQLSEVLIRLREDAHPMPILQLNRVLRQAWGDGWERRFKRFGFTPLAAASIGQVHEATLHNGDRLAIKVQYPGIRRSIDSDVDNVAGVLRLFRLLPEDLDFSSILDEAKRQLHAEADYHQEAAALRSYAAHLAGDARFEIPRVIEELTTREVMVMSYLDGQPIESLADQPATLRNQAAASLLDLALHEAFEWGLVQTDPNFSNYLYAPESGRIQLLDFGATRSYGQQEVSALRHLLAACIEGDKGDVARNACQVGYLAEDDPEPYREFVVQLLHMVTEPARSATPYKFGQTDLAQRMSEVLIEMRIRSRFGRLPPVPVLFLHRKLGGLYLQLSRLRASLPVRELVSSYLGASDL